MGLLRGRLRGAPGAAIGKGRFPPSLVGGSACCLVGDLGVEAVMRNRRLIPAVHVTKQHAGEIGCSVRNKRLRTAASPVTTQHSRAPAALPGRVLPPCLCRQLRACELGEGCLLLLPPPPLSILPPAPGGDASGRAAASDHGLSALAGAVSSTGKKGVEAVILRWFVKVSRILRNAILPS
ncbi:hypothetical protein NDU88_002506 [Pleurodeles waltl]|uniref:Uncharacterized protein n=1 Tax=Pleurodeles waltl TaxID=8319 RepID=A0AAV7T3S4_PLEWA|nr:hypothetical protein NDU88_002506 [Pleurodeles waltl]